MLARWILVAEDKDIESGPTDYTCLHEEATDNSLTMNSHDTVR